MVSRKCLDLQDIARSNYHWNERKTRINLILSAAILMVFLLGVFIQL